MPYSTIIVEDEENDAELLQSLLKKYPEIHIYGQADTVTKARNLILEVKPDIVFLDIDLYGESAFDLLEKIKDYKLSFRIIFTTAYNQFAIEAIKYAAFDYLLKPIEFDALQSTINRLKETNPNHTEHLNKINKLNQSFNKIIIEEAGKDIYLKPDDILYLQAVKGENYTMIHLVSGEKPITIAKGLGEFEKKILNGNFLKVHRSYTINANHLKGINSTKGIIHVGEEQIEISRGKAAELRRFIRNSQK